MRLTREQQEIIRRTTREVFGPEATVWLFGSRVDESQRGGDIDLLIEAPTPVEERERKVLRLTARLQIRLGDQPIDVLVLDPETPRQRIHDEALRTGVAL